MAQLLKSIYSELEQLIFTWEGRHLVLAIFTSIRKSVSFTLSCGREIFSLWEGKRWMFNYQRSLESINSKSCNYIFLKEFAKVYQLRTLYATISKVEENSQQKAMFKYLQDFFMCRFGCYFPSLSVLTWFLGFLNMKIFFLKLCR